MGRFVVQEWESRFATDGLSRRQRQSGTYRAYIPDPLVGRRFSLDAAVAADVADAEREIARFDTGATSGLLGRKLRAEAVASSEIEGIAVSAKRLHRAEMERADGKSSTDATAVEVLANVEAMMVAISSPEISVQRILEVHRTLLAPTSQAPHAGKIRSEQNWIGGTGYGPFGAAFVPPPPENVLELLDDLCRFCNEDSLSTVVQAAVAHAQFETIHPFVDGNGRTGRALIQMIFRLRRLTTRTVLPVSRILAERIQEYVAALASTGYEGPPDALAALSSANDWVRLFARACSRAVADAESVQPHDRSGAEESVAALVRSGYVLKYQGDSPMVAVHRNADDPAHVWLDTGDTVRVLGDASDVDHSLFVDVFAVID